MMKEQKYLTVRQEETLVNLAESKNRQIVREIEDIRYKDPARTERLCRMLIAEGKHSKSDYLLCVGEYYMGEAMWRLGKPMTKVISYAARSNAHAQAAGELIIEARAKNLLGILFAHEGDYQTALEYYLEGIKLLRGNKTSYLRRILNNNIGDLYMDLGDYKTALRYFKKGYEQCMEWMSREKNTAKMESKNIWVLNLAETYYCMGRYQDALDTLQDIDATDVERYGSYYLPPLYSQYSKVYFKLGNREKALEYAKKVLAVARQGIEKADSIRNYIEICDVLLELEQLELARELIDILYDVAEKMDSLYYWKVLYASIVRFYEKDGNNEKKLAAYEKYYEYSEQFDMRSKKNKLTAMNNKIALKKTMEEQQRVRQKTQALKILSEQDALTGIANRYALNQICDEQFTKAEKKEKNFGVIIFDIDFFKEYNDCYGHLQGDECLKTVGSILKTVASENCFPARYGGDEFFVITYDKTKEEMYRLAMRIQGEMECAAIRHKASQVSEYVTLTQGIVCEVPRDGQNAQDFIHLADNALYKAKAKRKGTVGFYGLPAE